MTVDVQFSVAARYRATRTLWQIALVMAWLLFRVSPLAGQQDPDEVTGSFAADEPAASVGENYSGPAVLSRGNQPAIVGGQVDTLQPFLNVNRVYGTGLGGGLSGSAPNALQSGVELGFGLKGTHRWKRITLQIEYDGSYRDYTMQTDGNGLNQLVIATAALQLQRHLVLSIRQTGGILAQDMGGLLLQPAFLETSSTLPANEPFSTGSKLINSIVTLTYQKTRRLSFSGSIEGSLVRQDSVLLSGTNSGILSADVGYRLSGRDTIGLDYSFSHFGYTSFGSSDVHSAGMDYSWRATKTVDLLFQVGMAHSSTMGIVAVPIDPEIAAILGTSTGMQVSYRAMNTPIMNARITKRWRRTSADLGYRRGISPGNGLVLASTEESMTAGLRYSGANRWTVSVEAGRTTMAQLAGVGSYAGNTFGASLNRLIRPGLQAVARFSVLPVTYNGSQGLNRTFYRAQIGFVFSPSQIPIALR
jgi:hypothetical protein